MPANEVLERTASGTDNGNSLGEPPSNPKTRKLPRVAVFALLIVVGAGIVWASPLRGILFGGKDADRTIALSGRIEGDDSAVASKTTGRILEVRVREGDSVIAGQVLAMLDDQQIRARADRAREAVDGAEARAKAAKAQIEVLNEQRREGQLQTEQAKADAEGRVAQADADLAAAESDLARQEAQFQLASFDKDAYTRLAQTGSSHPGSGFR